MSPSRHHPSHHDFLTQSIKTKHLVHTIPAKPTFIHTYTHTHTNSRSIKNIFTHKRTSLNHTKYISPANILLQCLIHIREKTVWEFFHAPNRNISGEIKEKQMYIDLCVRVSVCRLCIVDRSYNLTSAHFIIRP